MKKRIAKQTRKTRSLHKNIGIGFLLFFLLISISGLLLGLKDEFGLKPKTNSINTSKEHWVSIQELDSIGSAYAATILDKDPEIDRIDIRPDKGIAKILYKNHFTEVQLGLEDGSVLSVSSRADHFIERLHDGSIIDFYLTKSNAFELIYIIVVSAALLFMIYSGYLLWNNPKRIKKHKNK